MAIKKLTLMSILTAVALIIFMVEAQIPIPIPVPGVKLGLANAVILFALFFERKETDIKLTKVDAFAILLCRILLGALFTGRLVAFAYSLTGGLLAFTVQVVLKRFVTKKQIWVCGAAGAVFHNIGQIAAAVIITGTPSIALYLPMLIIAGIVTGVVTGLIAQLTLERI
ncbi:MAG: Gx transporter family protein [Oscillospiraceae bacterium]|nr:Gx transporter family protein [Oscillospiraceae bacterium]